MSASTVSPLPRGKTADDATLSHLLGMEKKFPDVNFASSAAVKPVLSGMAVTCRYVSNENGSAILPGELVKISSNTITGVEQADSGDDVCGIADEYLPTAGVADDEFFWIVVEGPTKVLAGATISAGAHLGTDSTSGRAAADASDPPNADVFGRAIAAGTDGNTFRSVVNCKRFGV